MNRARILLLLCAVALFAVGCTRIRPDEIGVHTINLGIGKGIVARDFGAGMYRNLWPIDTWTRFPRTVQTIRFAKDAVEPDGRRSEPLAVTSADGDRVMLTAEVYFRIADDHAHRVLQDSGPGQRYRDVVRGLSIDAARAIFGQLATEDFYNPQRRGDVRLKAVQFLQERLRARGIELVDLLTIAIEFDAGYENLIKQKKIADQRVQLELSKAKAAEEKGKVEKIRAETGVKVQTIQRESEARMTRMRTEIEMRAAAIRAEAEKYARQRRADADLYKTRRDAEGRLLVKSAEAEGTERMNQALAGEGGQNLAALEAAKNLQLTEVTFPSTGFDWFDPHHMAQRLGAESGPRRTSDVPLAPEE